MTDPILPPDEQERSLEIERRERPRERVADDVERVIESEAVLADRAGRAHSDPLERIAAERRRVQVVAEARRVQGVDVARHAIDLVFFLIYAVLGVRLALGILGANPAAQFARWIAGAFDTLYQPFRTLFPNVTVEDRFTFGLSVAFTILVYALLQALIHAILRVLVLARRAF